MTDEEILLSLKPYTSKEEVIDKAIDALEKQASTAYWKHVVNRVYMCTNCGYQRAATPNYCEECGAKIIGVKHGKEK